ARPGGGARLRGGRDGERGRGLLPRDAPPPRSGDGLARRAQAGRRGDRARARTHVVRRPGHHGVVGRPLAERGVRHLDGVPCGRRLAARVAQAWIAQPGFPLVTIAPAGDGGRAALAVRQERFFADPRVPATRRRVKWPVPLVVKWRGGGDAATERYLVDQARDRLELPARAASAWYFGNADAGGFYRVAHDPADRAALLADLSAGLTAVERLVGGVAEAPAVLAEARRRLDAYLADRSALEPNLADPVVSLAARVGDLALYDRYRAAVAAAATPQERRRFLLSLGSFRTRPARERTLAAV